MSNIICYDSDNNLLKMLYQWDNNQTMTVRGVDTSTVPLFHFCNRLSNLALVVAPTVSGSDLIVDIPNILLQQAEPIIVYLYRDNNYGGRTEHVIHIPVIPRPKPDDYEYEDNVEYISVVLLKSVVDDLKQRVDDLPECLPVAGGTMYGDVDMRGHKISNLPTPVDPRDAVHKKYFDDAIAGIIAFDYRVVEELPETGEKGIIYLIAHSHGSQDVYDEYIWISNKFEKIGNTDVNLSDYIKKDGSSELTGNLNMGGHRIAQLDTPQPIAYQQEFILDSIGFQNQYFTLDHLPDIGSVEILSDDSDVFIDVTDVAGDTVFVSMEVYSPTKLKILYTSSDNVEHNISKTAFTLEIPDDDSIAFGSVSLPDGFTGTERYNYMIMGAIGDDYSEISMMSVYIDIQNSVAMIESPVSGEYTFIFYYENELYDAGNCAATRKYVDSAVDIIRRRLLSYLRRDGADDMTGDLNVNFNRILNVPDPLDAGDAANKAYVDAKITSTFTKGVVITTTRGAAVTLNAGNTTFNGTTGTAVFDAAVGTLTITDLTGVKTINTTDGSLTVIVKGTNTIGGENVSNVLWINATKEPYKVPGDLTIKGDGTLNAAGKSYIVGAQVGNLTITESVKLNVTAATGVGMHVAANGVTNRITIGGKANVKVAAKGIAVYAAGANVGIYIQDDAVVETSGVNGENGSDAFNLTVNTVKTGVENASVFEVSGNTKVTSINANCGVRENVTAGMGVTSVTHTAVVKDKATLDVTARGQVVYQNANATGITTSNGTFTVQDSANVKLTGTGYYVALSIRVKQNAVVNVLGGMLEMFGTSAISIVGTAIYNTVAPAGRLLSILCGNSQSTAVKTDQIDGSKNYVKVSFPKAITLEAPSLTDGDYTLKAHVENGTVTYSWVGDTTTDNDIVFDP